MTAEEIGELIGNLLYAFFVLAVVVCIVWAIIYSRRKPAGRTSPEAYWSAVFALEPGERLGPVWQAAHALGHPMAVTITSGGVFALNYQAPQGPPLRLRPEGVSVQLGAAHMVTLPPGEPMVEVTLVVPGRDPQAFALSQSGATALAAWAFQSPTAQGVST